MRFRMVSQSYTYHVHTQTVSKAQHVYSEMCQSYKDLLQMSKVHSGGVCVCVFSFVHKINNISTCHTNNHWQHLEHAKEDIS